MHRLDETIRRLADFTGFLLLVAAVAFATRAL
jgi:hypothetical protein